MHMLAGKGQVCAVSAADALDKSASGAHARVHVHKDSVLAWHACADVHANVVVQSPVPYYATTIWLSSHDIQCVTSGCGCP